MHIGRVLVYGGKGALGSVCVNKFKSNNWWVGSVDMAKNESADASIIIPSSDSWVEQETEVLKQVGELLNGEKLDAVICVAGGWAGGNAEKDLAKNADIMLKQSVWTSVISASVGAKYLKSGGVITLTGAKAALEGTPGMIAYGLAKAAVHHLTKSLAEKNSGLPENSLVVSILPVTLDTPMNRKWMPKADHSSWTPLDFVADLFVKWAKGEERPVNGGLLQLVTTNGQTTVTPAQ